MPEIVTKYPDVVMTILKDARVKCGQGEPQKILIHCPKENFCSFPTGELCVYSTKEIHQMSQITAWDMIRVTDVILPLFGFTVMVLLLGVLIGIKVGK